MMHDIKNKPNSSLISARSENDLLTKNDSNSNSNSNKENHLRNMNDL